MQFGQRDALIEIVEAQNWHSFVTVSAADGLSTALLIRFTCLTIRNTASATIRKPMMSLKN